MHLGATKPEAKRRQAIEAQIVRAIVAEALKLGYSLSVYDGEEQFAETTVQADVLKQMMETDEDYLHILKNGQSIGWVRFVYGNDGWDVICDYSATPETEAIVAVGNKIADGYE